MRRALALAVVGLCLVVAPARAVTNVNAEGNVFTGGLGFDPPSVTVDVGQVVRWTNTDPVVPHTATEDHGLWDLAGDYGMTPANPSGFGPGETRERTFEAGTQHYHCRVHPAQMMGVVAVPVHLEKAVTRAGARKKVLARWSLQRAADNRLFDVERKRGAGDWKPLRTATGLGSVAFTVGLRQETWSVRARLRSASDPSAATDWSPVATIKAGGK